VLLQSMQEKLVFLGYVLLQNDAYISLRSCIYWAKILNDCEAQYIACDREALVVVETLSRVYMIYLIGCK